MSKIASVIKSIAPRKYVYTFANHKNQFVDPRFKVKQVSRILNKNEVEHINSTIDDAFREFQTQKSIHSHPYLSKQLIQSISELREILNQKQMSICMKRQDRTQIISKGNYEVRGIKYPVDGLFMDQIKASKIGDVVYCTLRDAPQVSEQTKLQQAKKEYGQRFKTRSLKGLIMNNKLGAQVKKFLQYKEQIAQNSFYNKFKSNLSEYSIIVDQIPIDVRYTIMRNNNTFEQNNLTISTKWLHEVEEKTAASVKKQPKRILFDIQDWHRGFFVPLRRFDVSVE